MFFYLKDSKKYVKMSVHSSDKTYIDLELNEGESDMLVTKEDLKNDRYVAAIYDERWYIGVILEISEENHDARIKLMHNKVGINNFFWPSRDDICFIPFAKIISLIEIPVLAVITGRNYKINSYYSGELDKRTNCIIKEV